MPPLLSIDEALARVLARVRPLAAEPVPVAEAAGRVLAEDVAALVDLPPFPSSAMDGFAVRAEDVPGELPVVFRIAAGRARRAAARGRARRWRSRRAAPCRREPTPSCRSSMLSKLTTACKCRIRSTRERTSGRSAATSAPATPLLAAGTVLGAAQVGALAAAGVAEVVVQPPAQALSFSAPAPSSARRASRSVQARSTSRTARCSRRRSRPPARWSSGSDRSPTTRRSTARALERGLEADVLVSSGGVSVGPHDLVRRILGELGVEEDFWGVAVRPGKPLAFATRGATLVFGLPGQPRLVARRGRALRPAGAARAPG